MKKRSPSLNGNEVWVIRFGKSVRTYYTEHHAQQMMDAVRANKTEASMSKERNPGDQGRRLMEFGGFNVFTRTWWRENATWPGGLEPAPGKRRYLARGVTRQRALEICKQYNTTHEPGRLSKKAEFEEAS